jgi:hypothetical protein
MPVPIIIVHAAHAQGYPTTLFFVALNNPKRKP